ncbi:hypothetical protein B0H14DRAFT_3711861 [Mycena olivaceomarginata]|nr:hypothetical protein B0H14DRAFT_3711861 [Mycena olivaceomarginata]
MSIDPDDPGRKTVFKVNTNKLGFSKNTPEACGYCQRKRSDGETPYVSVVVARSIRFCNAEHQKAYWPQHKAICKDAQKRKQMQDEFGAPEEFALGGTPPPSR